VFSRINLSDLSKAIAKIDLMMIGLAALLNLGMVYLMAERWRWLIRIKYPAVSCGLLFRHYLIGLFFNMFTPGAVGGDLSRLLAIGQATGDRSFVFATLVLERLVGMCGLVLAGLGGIYFGKNYLEHPAVYYIIAVILLIGLALSCGIFSRRVTN